jgi:hypothetical protein
MRGHGGHPRGALALWWGYLPLAAGGMLFAAMVVVAPSDRPAGSGAADVREVADAEPASGWGTTVTPCTDRALQVEGDGYSPPCYAFDGDNGGATARGVTAERIRVAYRMNPGEPHLLKVLADLAEIPLDETPEELARTAEGLTDYFNQRFQFYGREIELVRVTGTGSVINELTGGGHDQAANDALKVADDVGAFADVTAFTQPYADALSDRGVVNVGVAYMSREWFADRRPYAWSNLSDCSVAAEASSEVATQAILGRPASHAGAELAGEPRRLGLVGPNNLEYQQCVDAGVDVLEQAGFEVDYRTDYVLNLSTITETARSIVAQLRDNRITSVACACDPIMAMRLAEYAEQQHYEPEWLVLGVGFTDLDLVGQIIQQGSGDQWSRAFGGSTAAAAVPLEESAGYRAYRSVRDDEPSQLVDLVYYQLLQLAIGIQMAGPTLTPANFETGMFSYPEGSGGAGTWDFSPGHYTGVVDIRIVWWDPDQVSPFDGEPGTYRDDGSRYREGEVPDELEVFDR